MKILSVRELNNYISSVYNKDFVLKDFLIRGELSNYKESHGNYFFSIKDEDGTAIDCIMFGSVAKALPYDFESGQSVIIGGRASFYEKTGRTSIVVKTMEIEGLGAYYIELEKLKKKLEEKGMFDSMYKKDIPTYTRKIGIITSKTGAAIEDIKRTIWDKNPHVEIVLYPAKVQGEDAADTLIAGVEELNKMDIDVIILARGGGSKEDLIAFNDERLAYAIFKSEIPIISAVGHEIDTSIADLVADKRVATPTAAGEAATYDYAEFLSELEEIEEGLKNIVYDKLKDYRDKIDNIEEKLVYLSPKAKIDRYIDMYEDRKRSLNDSIFRKYDNVRYRYNEYIEKMKACDVLDKMKKGFAYVTDDKGKKVVSIKKVKRGARLNLRLSDGKIKVKAE